MADGRALACASGRGWSMPVGRRRSGDGGEDAVSDLDGQSVAGRDLGDAGDAGAVRGAAHDGEAAPDGEQRAERVEAQGRAAQLLAA